MEHPSFYRRPLPAPLIAFASGAGREIFHQALAAGGLENYFPLAEQFNTQDEPSYCGISSLVMVLNALGVDPGANWKGPWRWYDEKIADCCEQLPVIKAQGSTLAHLAMMALCNSVKVEARHADQTSLEQFRQTVQRLCQTAVGIHMIAGYSRERLGQTGDGHFSPVGGYHAGRDLVLILDVARFKYPPHWVALERLWQAMNATDSASGASRGYIIIEHAGDAPLLAADAAPPRK